MKMKLFFILLACSIDFSSAQRKREPTYWTVIVPDSIATLLDKDISVPLKLGRVKY